MQQNQMFAKKTFLCLPLCRVDWDSSIKYNSDKLLRSTMLQSVFKYYTGQIYLNMNGFVKKSLKIKYHTVLKSDGGLLQTSIIKA